MGGSLSPDAGSRRFESTSMLVVLCCASACADSVDPVVWGGSEPHIIIHGLNEGVATDSDVYDAIALQTAMFHCERDYEVPVIDGVPDPSMARLTATQVAFFFSSQGRPTVFRITVEQHDLQADPLGTTLEVTPRREGVAIGPEQVIFEMTLVDVMLNERFLHVAAKYGEITLYDFSGNPPPGSRVIPAGEGFVGLTYDIAFNPESYFRGSFMAPCTITRVVQVVR